MKRFSSKAASRTAQVLIGESTVTKTLNDPGRLDAESAALSKLQELMPGKRYNSWCFRAGKPLAFDIAAASIVMERAPGRPLSDLLRRRVELCAIAGIWLALFHSQDEVPAEQAETPRKSLVPVFGDFGTNHVFVDDKSRTCTVIDPGLNVGELEEPERDVAYMCVALFLYSVRSLVNPSPRISEFLRGYSNPTHTHIHLESLRSYLSVALQQSRRRWLRSSNVSKRWLGVVLYPIVGRMVVFLTLRALHTNR